MGNYRFKFSDMMPNAWFYKLKYMTKNKRQNSMQKPSKKKNQPKQKSPLFSSLSSSNSAAAVSNHMPPQAHHHLSQQRKSYHITRELNNTQPPPPPPPPDNNSASQIIIDPPRKSSKRRRSIKKNRGSNRGSPRLLLATSSANSADCSCRASLESSCSTKPDSTPENYPLDSCSSDDSLFPEMGSGNEQPPTYDEMASSLSNFNSCHSRAKSDIPLGMPNYIIRNSNGFDSVSQFDLPPIITKIDKIEENDADEILIRRRRSANSYRLTNSFKEQKIISPVKKLSSSNHSPGVKLRTNSPRITGKRLVQVHHRKSVSSGGGARRSLSESFAVVKTSEDPHRDFKESMVEMIMENNIRASKDLEELLACYLSLNSHTYHHLIIKAFQQIWFETTDSRLTNES